MSTAKRSGTYNPAEHGLAKYFLSMLDDKDRNVKYGEAIKKCIEEFETKEQRKPRVLDIGIGTGMLSSLCLLHGAAHVTGVDVNSTMVGLARASLRALDPGGRRHNVLLVRPGPSALPPEERFDMVVSEILGTLTTSESMFKYVSIYRHHLNTFGADHKVYAVPQQTTQYAALHRFSRQDLGEPLSAALEVALGARDAFGRFMPSNEGGLALPLYLWKSELVGGKRHAIHTESYEALPPRAEGQGADGGGGGSFVANGLERPVVYEAETLNTACDEDAFVLCVLEWSVKLWGDVKLDNTLEAYRGMPLRNALARASAWGFFIADVPSLRSGVPRRAPLTVRANRMNAAAGQGTPELVIDGHRVANVCEEPAPYVAMAADADAADRLFEALKALRSAGASAAAAPVRSSPRIGNGKRKVDEASLPGSPSKRACKSEPQRVQSEPQRVLIVNDTTAGKLPFEAAVLGFDVNVVNDDQLATEAGKRAVEALAAAAAPSSEAKPGRISWHVGRVATGGAEARKTRGAFMPSKQYDAVVLGAALLDEMRDDKHRLEHSKAIVDRWSKTRKGIPEPAQLHETDHAFDRADFYKHSLPEAFKGRRCLAGVEGALRALGEPCAQADGGAPFATNDDGLVFHGVHTVRIDRLYQALESPMEAPKAEETPVPRRETNGESRRRSRIKTSSVCASSADRSAPSDEPSAAGAADADEIRAGVRECSAKLPDGEESLAATLEAFAKLLTSDSDDPRGLHQVLEQPVSKLSRGARSAVARATYLGVKLRLRREAPKRPKTAAA